MLIAKFCSIFTKCAEIKGIFQLQNATVCVYPSSLSCSRFHPKFTSNWLRGVKRRGGEVNNWQLTPPPHFLLVLQAAINSHWSGHDRLHCPPYHHGGSRHQSTPYMPPYQTPLEEADTPMVRQFWPETPVPSVPKRQTALSLFVPQSVLIFSIIYLEQ